MLGSILHRACLMALYVGALILTGWVIALSFGPDAYAAYAGLLGSLLGKLVLIGLTFCVFFQISSTVRHALWDTGQAFTPKTADTITIASIVFAVVCTAAVWILAGVTGGLS